MNDRERYEAMSKAISEIRKHVIPWSKVTQDEKRRYVVDQLCNFAEEINSAYWEQVGGLVNYRLTLEDVSSLWSTAEWAAYDLALEFWRRDEQNDAAWQLHEHGDRSDGVKERMGTAPAEPKRARMQPPRDCPLLPTVERPRRWDSLVEEFLKRRRLARGDGR